MCSNYCNVYLPEELTEVDIKLLPEIETLEFLECFDYSDDDKIFEDLSLRHDFNEDLLVEVSRQALLQATVSKGDYRSQKRIIDKPVKYMALKNGFIRLQYECRGDPSLQYRHGENMHWGYVDFRNDEISEVFCSCRDFFYRVYYHMATRYKLSKWRLTGRYKPKMLASVGSSYNAKRRHDAPVHPRQEGPYRWTNKEGDLFLCKHLYDAVNRYIGPKAKIPPLLGKPVIPGHRQQYIDQRQQAKEIERNLKNKKVAHVEPKIVKQVVVPPQVQPVVKPEIQPVTKPEVTTNKVQTPVQTVQNPMSSIANKKVEVPKETPPNVAKDKIENPKELPDDEKDKDKTNKPENNSTKK